MTSWSYNDQPAGFSLPECGLTPEQSRELRDLIWSFLVAGHAEPEYFAILHGDRWPLTPEQLSAAYEHACDVRLRQQAQWADEQIRTNLDLAFEDLNAVGVIARQDFTCCGSCGAAEIGDERDDSRHWQGYVFFHQQDTQTIAENGSVYLSYGLFEPGDLKDLREFVNGRVVPRLTARGLDVEWDNDDRVRILVRGVQSYVSLS